MTRNDFILQTISRTGAIVGARDKITPSIAEAILIDAEVLADIAEKNNLFSLNERTES